MVLRQIPTISPSNPGVREWGMSLIGTLIICNFLITNEAIILLYYIHGFRASTQYLVCNCGLHSASFHDQLEKNTHYLATIHYKRWHSDHRVHMHGASS